MYKYFNEIVGFKTGNYIYSWKSKLLPDEIIKPTMPKHKLTPEYIFLVLKQE